MQVWSEFELNRYLETLAKNDTHDVAQALFFYAELDKFSEPEPVPTDNAKVTAYLEKLIEDRRRYSLVLTRTITFIGELRWLAAQVLACEYACQGIETPIILEDVMQPRKFSDFWNVKLTIDELIEQGLFTIKTEIIKPQDYADCCSKDAVEERMRKQNSNE